MSYKRTPTESSWWAMMTRCFNKHCHNYYDYGGRGITACDFIKVSFRSIIGLIGERPLGKTLDRIDNSGNYSCGSCDQCKKWKWNLNIQWSTPSRQQRNRRNTRLLVINGVEKCISDWADEAGIPVWMIRNRLNLGWSGADLLKPKVEWGKLITLGGRTMNVKDWSKELGIWPGAFQFRLKRGWTESELLLGKQKPRQVYKFYDHD